MHGDKYRETIVPEFWEQWKALFYQTPTFVQYHANLLTEAER